MILDDPVTRETMEAYDALCVAEDLHGWRTLRSVVDEKGCLNGAYGCRVVKLWGAQLSAALDHLRRHGLRVPDVRLDHCFVSADGARAKLLVLEVCALLLLLILLILIIIILILIILIISISIISIISA